LLFTRDWENWGRILKRFRTYVPSLLTTTLAETGAQFYFEEETW